MPYKDITVPTHPGWYWFRAEGLPPSREDLVAVRAKAGQLTVEKHNEDVPVASLQGSWRGPIIPYGSSAAYDRLASADLP